MQGAVTQSVVVMDLGSIRLRTWQCERVWPPMTQGYLPGQLYNLDSKFGNKEQLQGLNAALKQAGLRPVADIVVNHRCADQQDENGIWNMFRWAPVQLPRGLPGTVPPGDASGAPSVRASFNALHA